MNQNGNRVVLSMTEMLHALSHVSLRMATSHASDLNHATTYERSFHERVVQEFIGICGEMAVAKFRDKWWIPPLNEFHRTPDVAATEVRSTYREDGCLILRDNDPDDRFYVLVTGTPPVLNIVGYIRGRDGKADEFRRNPNGYRLAWFVPQDALIKPQHKAAA